MPARANQQRGTAAGDNTGSVHPGAAVRLTSMLFNAADIRNSFDSGTYARGADYARRGKVVALNPTQNHITGQVSGSGAQDYIQSIGIRISRGTVRFQGECDCPMAYNCKHVVAVLLSCLAQGGTALVAAPQPAALPPALAAWMSNVQYAVSEAAKRVASENRTSFRPMYVLIPDRPAGSVQIRLSKVKLGAGAQVASAAVVADLYGALSSPPAWLRPDDLHALRLFVAMSGRASVFSDRMELCEAAGAYFLRLVLDRGELGWSESNAALRAGQIRRLAEAPPRCAALAWRERAAEAGMLRLDWRFDDGRPVDILLPTEPPMYVSIGEAHIGELILPEDTMALPLWELQRLAASAPAVPLQAADALARSLDMQGLATLLPPPPAVRQLTRTDVIPRPRLQLGAREAILADTGARYWEDFAVLGFEYDGIAVTAGAAPEIVRASAAGREVIVRDTARELAARNTLAALGFSALSALPVHDGLMHLPHASHWLQFTREHLPQLRADGWLVTQEGSYRFDLADVDDWYAEVASSHDGEGGNAWFELELGIVVNGARVALLPLLLQLIRNAPQEFAAAALDARQDHDLLLAELPGNVKVGLPWGRIKPMLSTLGELYFTERVGDALRLPVREAARLAELEAHTQLRWNGGEQLRAIGHKLRDLVHAGDAGAMATIAAPQGLQASLRPYQLAGLAWMQFLREYQLGGILADDMGLGKTIQTLAHILLEKEAGRLTAPALVVAPTSLMGNWQQEAARFAPGLRVLLLHGAERAARFDQIGQYDLVLTTYALLPRDEAALCAQRFHLLILDESQYIKNSRSKAALTAALLPATHRLCLTGTPLQNHLGELWAQFHFLMPGLLGDEKVFNASFRRPVEKLGDSARNAFLVRRIRPFMLRRTKDTVATELPAKTEMVREVELSGVQRDLYETMRLAMDKKVRDAIASKGVARSQIIILDALLKLRQVCCDPRLVKLAGFATRKAPSAKLVTLLEMVGDLLGEGRKILVFSQFTSMLALIEAELQARSIAYALLTGDTRDRSGQVDAFQRGEVSVFLISLKAGGVGLNLTAADTVIHYDPWWNPAAENQATDRAWRIGQDKPVFVYKLIAAGTLEQKIQELQRKKSALADAVLAGGTAPESLFTADDLQAILAPL